MDVISRRGRVRNVELRVTEIVAPGQVFMPFHFAETNANQVTQSAFDPISREPNYKQCAVSVQLSVSPKERRSQRYAAEEGTPGGGELVKKLVVVGNGMAGIACVEQILRHSPKFEITIFGDETHVNYNRILLSSVLAGEKSSDDIVLNGLDWYQQNGIDLRLGVRIAGVDSQAKTVTGDDGSVTPFDKLLLATGSNPLIPSIEEVKKEGVFVFRNLDDTRALLERCRPGIKAVVIGGGLLGLEAARGLQVQGCEVTVVHLMETLMERQLDPTGGGYLAAKMNQMGITVLLGLSTTAILGNGKVEGVQFKGGGSIPADLVVIAAGIRPNVGLGARGRARGKARHCGQRLYGNLAS